MVDRQNQIESTPASYVALLNYKVAMRSVHMLTRLNMLKNRHMLAILVCLGCDCVC